MSKIISEIGVNWQGDTSIAKDMIIQSKRAGADYVKFQLFDETIIKDSRYKSELSGMIIDYSKLKFLRDYSHGAEIGFGVSCMYPEAFDIIRQLKNPVDFIKIREKDRQNEKVARPAVKYCDEYKVPLLISTKIPTRDNDYYRYNLYNTKNAKYLYCVPKYPPELSDIYSSYINPDFFDGFSSHFPSKFIPMVAVCRDLKFIEIHVKRPTREIYEDGLQIDENVSLDFDDLKEICDFRNIIASMR